MFSKNESIKLKGIGILLLLFHHLFYDKNLVEFYDIQFGINYEFIQSIAIAARICVWIFVFISAYGLTYQYLNRKDETKTQFILKRWIILMSTYWVAYIVVFVLLCSAGQNPCVIYENSFIKLMLDAIGWADFFSTPTLSGAWWYMLLAQLLIVSIPLLVAFCKKLGGGSSFIVTFIILQYLPEGIVSAYGGRYSNYFLVIILGVSCAQSNIFDKLLKICQSKIIQFGEALFYIGVICIILLLRIKILPIDLWQLASLCSAICTFMICLFSIKCINIRFINQFLIFLGKHSANIFMIHTVFYTYYSKYIFWSKNAIVIFISLLVISIFFSIMMEQLKKSLHYNDKWKKVLRTVIHLN